MPRDYGRFRTRKRAPARKRTLSRRNIAKRTSAKSQSRQIATLSRTLNRTQHETIRTYWQRNSYPCETLATAGFPYMCPIPRMAMDPRDKYAPGSGLTNTWTDTLAVAAQPYFQKKIMFGCSDAALNTGTLIHTGGLLKYQLSCNDDSMSKATIALISLKPAAADQKTVDNFLRSRTTPPFGPSASTAPTLRLGTDYVIHNGVGSSAAGDTSFGCVINRQYWNVHYQRECAFGHIGAGGITNNINPANTNPANNAVVATGTIKLPAYGEIKSFATNPAPANPVTPGQNAMELGLYDEQQEKALYLVVISNGVTIDDQGLYLGMLGTDFYRAVV